MKQCSKCLEIKAIEDFQLRSSSKDGRRGTCAKCTNARKLEILTPEQRKKKVERRKKVLECPIARAAKNAKGREYKARNRAKVLEYNSAYRKENSQKIKVARRARYQICKEKILAYHAGRKEVKAAYDKLRVQREKERLKAQGAEWKRLNKDALKAQRATRAARKKSAEGAHTKQDIEAIYAHQKGECRYCKVELNGNYHLDHRVPLSRGGSNWPVNLQILCGPCNVKKWAKDPEVFELEIGFIA